MQYTLTYYQKWYRSSAIIEAQKYRILIQIHNKSDTTEELKEISDQKNIRLLNNNRSVIKMYAVKYPENVYNENYLTRKS